MIFFSTKLGLPLALQYKHRIKGYQSFYPHNAILNSNEISINKTKGMKLVFTKNLIIVLPFVDVKIICHCDSHSLTPTCPNHNCLPILAEPLWFLNHQYQAYHIGSIKNISNIRLIKRYDISHIGYLKII